MNEYPLYDKVHEAVGKFRADTGEVGNSVTLHPMSRNELIRELELMNGESVEDRNKLKISGCWVKASLTCPKGYALVERL